MGSHETKVVPIGLKIECILDDNGSSRNVVLFVMLSCMATLIEFKVDRAVVDIHYHEIYCILLKFWS